MAKKIRKSDALEYHAKGRPGKIEVKPTKETKTQRDLALAYSPGVAEPCLEIARDEELAYKYTTKGNLVAVISNGTAVLGLGDIGAAAGKPVMEGKGLLFKIYADIDVFDIEVNTKDTEEFIRTVKNLEPTFGGINLEDIKAPECFEIEQRLKKELNIPIMHDDQHGTAIISGAALLNASLLQGKQLKDLKIVVSGAGASAMACCRIYIALGATAKNILMFDSKGPIITSRTDLDKYKKEFAVPGKSQTLQQALKGADVFIGLSKGNILQGKDIKVMAKKPIIFALANPTPEIDYNEAIKARPDVIMATGRSDYPNQVNNVLGFPYIFRGALDVRATTINEAMKLAAVHALAELAKLPVPESVNEAYGERNLTFGPNYIIPKPMDPRLLSVVAPAVAKAAIKSKVAKQTIKDWDEYAAHLRSRLGDNDQVMRTITDKAKRRPMRVAFADGENFKVIKAAATALEEGIAFPTLLGNEKIIKKVAADNAIDITDITIIDPKSDIWEDKREEFSKVFYELRQRRGYNLFEAKKIMRDRDYFSCMMLRHGMVDALIGGLRRRYAETLKPAIEVIGLQNEVSKIAGMYMMLTKRGPVFFSDASVNENPTREELVEIARLTANEVATLGIKPRLALLSYSNFGSSKLDDAAKMSDVVQMLKERFPDMSVDGEVQGAIAFNQELLRENYPFSTLTKEAPNVLIFPNLSASNIAYHLLMGLADIEAVGPILLGFNKSVHILQLGSSVSEILDMVSIAVVDAQIKSKAKK